MTSQIQEILCGGCRVAIQGPDNAGPKDSFECPKCGRSDTHENVIKSVEAYVVQEGQSFLDNSIRKMARGGTIFSVEGTSPERKTYPFIVELNL